MFHSLLLYRMAPLYFSLLSALWVYSLAGRCSTVTVRNICISMFQHGVQIWIMGVYISLDNIALSPS